MHNPNILQIKKIMVYNEAHNLLVMRGKAVFFVSQVLFWNYPLSSTGQLTTILRWSQKPQDNVCSLKTTISMTLDQSMFQLETVSSWLIHHCCNLINMQCNMHQHHYLSAHVNCNTPGPLALNNWITLKTFTVTTYRPKTSIKWFRDAFRLQVTSSAAPKQFFSLVLCFYGTEILCFACRYADLSSGGATEGSIKWPNQCTYPPNCQVSKCFTR